MAEKETNNRNIKKKRRKKRKIRKMPIIIMLLVICVVVAFAVLKLTGFSTSGYLFGKTEKTAKDIVVGKEGEVSVVAEAALENVFEISELSTANYTYNAIATAYAEDGYTMKYYVKYDGEVTVGIDFNNISIDPNEEEKLITIKIPEIEIQHTSVDPGNMEFIFKDKKYDTDTVSQEAYEVCKSDLENRVNSDDELFESARENAKTSIEALIKPWLDQFEKEYKVVIE